MVQRASISKYETDGDDNGDGDSLSIFNELECKVTNVAMDNYHDIFSSFRYIYILT